MSPRMSVVVPAHDEENVIAANLAALTAGAAPGELDVVVVCNGCTDRTAELARSVPGVRVAELAEPGKPGAMRHGDAMTDVFPRLYLDADVRLDTESARRLAAAVSEPGLLAAGPARRFDLSRSAWSVRAYYRLWEALPEVSTGLFGRGVIAISEPGYARLRSVPDARSDDLAVHLAFAAGERRIVPEAAADIRPPRTRADLFRRRVRALQGSRELQGSGSATARAGTSVGDLVALVRRRPGLAVAAPVFLAYGIAARLKVRYGRFDRSTWLRDESSRAA
jgi:glycosyltransferase involved in cell wall biosynthesis